MKKTRRVPTPKERAVAESVIPPREPQDGPLIRSPSDYAELGGRNMVPRVVKFPKDATPEERMAMAATGASLDRVRELQSLPNPENSFLEVLTGDPEIDALYRDCIKCFAEKGAEYTVGSKDRLANFKSVGAQVGEPMEKVWFTYFYKHYASLVSYIKNGCQVKSNEPIQSRIMDLIVYLTLFYKMTLEIEASRK